MNNGGWGLRAFILFCTFFVLAILLVVFTVNNVFPFLSGDDSYLVEGNTGLNKDDDDINSNIPNNDGNVTVPENTTYESLEQTVNDAALKYAQEYYKEVPGGDRYTVTLNSLIDEKMMTQIYDAKNNKTKCSGYAQFIKNDDGTFSTDAYIKCGSNYTSNNYVERFDV